ncbi:hypothetical protein Tco_0932958 [Tanacetum coccineum]
MKEVFLKEDIIVDGVYRNLTPPEGVIRSAGLVIREPKSGIFVYNGNFDLVFQRESKFHLETKNIIKVELVIAREMYDKMIYVIEASPDFIEAREVVQKNLDDLG